MDIQIGRWRWREIEINTEIETGIVIYTVASKDYAIVQTAYLQFRRVGQRSESVLQQQKRGPAQVVIPTNWAREYAV